MTVVIVQKLRTHGVATLIAFALTTCNIKYNSFVNLTYYVSSQGNDQNSGESPERSWRSLAKVNRTFLNPGDRVFLRSGDVWFERLQPSGSGTSSQPVGYGAYGSGAPPVIDGRGVPIGRGEGLIKILSKNVVIASLQIRNSAGDGIIGYFADGLRILNCIVDHNQKNGILIGSSSDTIIRGNDIYKNNLSGDQEYSGILVDKWDGGTVRNVIIDENKIHGNAGSRAHNGNGIKLGHTGDNLMTIKNLVITSNQIYQNGTMTQNQFGRGITASVAGDMLIGYNCIHDNASAGSYVGGQKLSFSVRYVGNVFSNNHLRGFGWIDDGEVHAVNNTVICDREGLPCVGIEFNGAGRFEIHHNIIQLKPHPRYGALVAVQQGARMATFSDNLYWDTINGRESHKFLLGDFRDSRNYHSFSEWVSITGDQRSKEVDPGLSDSALQTYPCLGEIDRKSTQ